MPWWFNWLAFPFALLKAKQRPQSAGACRKGDREKERGRVLKQWGSALEAVDSTQENADRADSTPNDAQYTGLGIAQSHSESDAPRPGVSERAGRQEPAAEPVRPQEPKDPPQQSEQARRDQRRGPKAFRNLNVIAQTGGRSQADRKASNQTQSASVGRATKRSRHSDADEATLVARAWHLAAGGSAVEGSAPTFWASFRKHLHQEISYMDDHCVRPIDAGLYGLVRPGRSPSAAWLLVFNPHRPLNPLEFWLRFEIPSGGFDDDTTAYVLTRPAEIPKDTGFDPEQHQLKHLERIVKGTVEKRDAGG